MSDPDRPDADESRFDDPAHAWVRDLLASSRDTGPVPADVAARLDATLASLRADRVGEPGGAASAPVVPLRRRLAPFLAAAAAVVVVAGGAVGVARLGSGGSDSSQSSAGAANADREGASASGGSVAPSAPAARSSGGATGIPALSRAAFARDAVVVMRTLSAVVTGSTPAPTSGHAGALDNRHDTKSFDATAGAAPVTATPGGPALGAPAAACPGPSAPGAVTLPATLDGTPVALVFRPPTVTSQRVEAWSCDGASLLVSATVPH